MARYQNRSPVTVQKTEWPDSLWRSTAERLRDCPELHEDIETDLLIIGAGYTGLSTALHAADAIEQIVILDQAQPGWGCSDFLIMFMRVWGITAGEYQWQR